MREERASLPSPIDDENPMEIGRSDWRNRGAKQAGNAIRYLTMALRPHTLHARAFAIRVNWYSTEKGGRRGLVRVGQREEGAECRYRSIISTYFKRYAAVIVFPDTRPLLIVSRKLTFPGLHF